MKYLITGSKGFIAKNLINHLSNENIITFDDEIFNFNNWKPKYNLETGIKKYLLYLDYDS